MVIFSQLNITKMKKIIKDTVIFAGANTISFVISALGGFLVAKILEPEGYGGFSAYKLFISYLINLHMGIFQGLQREIPFYRELQKEDKLKSLLNTTFSFTFLISLLSIIILLLSSITSSEFFRKSFFITLPLIPFYFLKEFYRFAMKGLEKFKELSFLNIFDSINFIVFVIFFSIYFKAEGAVLGFGISHFILFFFAYFFTRIIFFNFKIKFEDLKSLFQVGFPIFFIGVLNIFLFSIDRVFILGIYGRREFGIYAMAMNFLNLIFQVPIAVATIFLPFLTRKKAKEGSLSEFIIKRDYIIYIYLILVSLLIIIFYPMAFFVIKRFLHKYYTALPLLKFLLLFIPFPTLNYFFYSFLIAENKHSYIIPYHLILIPFTVIVNSVFIPKFELKGACLSYLISQFLFTLITIFLTYRFIKFKILRTITFIVLISFLHFLIFELIF